MLRLVFAGSSGFGIPALEVIVKNKYPLLVISQPDKPAGRKLQPRPCPVAEYALENKLPLYQPEDINAPESLARIASFSPDLIVTASYGALLKRTLRRIPRFGAINIHPSLLPKYRGASPIQTALLNGDSLTGITIFRLNAAMDAGDILIQRELQIMPEDNHTLLERRLSLLAAELLAELLPQYKNGELTGVKQDQTLASYTWKFSSEDTLIGWNQPAEQVLNRVRAFAEEPGAYTHFRDTKLKILAASLTAEPAESAPGTIQRLIKNIGFTVNCRDFQLLIETVKPAGKKKMDSHSFQLGARLVAGDTFYPANIPTREQP